MDHELLKKLKELLSEQLKENKDALKKEVIEDIKKSLEEKKEKGVADEDASVKELKEIKDRLEAIEKLPFEKKDVNINVKKQINIAGKKYDMHYQGQEIREKCLSNKVKFPVLSQEDKFNELSEFFLKGIHAIRGDIRSQMELQDAQQKATALSEGTDAQGGYLVPTEQQTDLIMLAKEDTFALANCTVLPMSRDSMTVPTELTRGAVAWIDEAGSITASNPTFGQVTLTVKKLAGLTASISNELLSDSAIDLASLLMNQFSYLTAYELDNQVLNGTGAPVSGVLTAKAGYSTVQSTGLDNFSSITADNLSEMISKLSPQYGKNAKFIYNKLIQHYVRTLKDSNNNYIWQRPEGSQPGTVWGQKYYVSDNAPSTSASSTAFVSYGDFSKFYIGRRQGAMVLQADPYTAFANDQTRFRSVTRWALAVAVANAFVRHITAS